MNTKPERDLAGAAKKFRKLVLENGEMQSVRLGNFEAVEISLPSMMAIGCGNDLTEAIRDAVDTIFKMVLEDIDKEGKNASGNL